MYLLIFPHISYAYLFTYSSLETPERTFIKFGFEKFWYTLPTHASLMTLDQEFAMKMCMCVCTHLECNFVDTFLYSKFTVHFLQLLLNHQPNVLFILKNNIWFFKTFNKNPYICFGLSMSPSSGGVTKTAYLF
jgi:hypothetical protein